VQIERHWNLFASPKLTLEKLQMIATSNASPEYKIMWFRWMNASVPIREAHRFLTQLVNEDKLLVFLAKACWYASWGMNFTLTLSYNILSNVHD